MAPHEGAPTKTTTTAAGCRDLLVPAQCSARTCRRRAVLLKGTLEIHMPVEVW